MCSKRNKNTNAKAFIKIKNKNEPRKMVKHISCDCKFKFNSAICNSNQKLNNKTQIVNVKIIVSAKKIIAES